MNRVLAQAKMETVLTLRRGESLLLTIVIPVLTLLGLSITNAAPIGSVAPGVLAISIIASSMTGLAISTGFDRSYGVLKLLGGSPLTRPQLIAAKVGSTMLIQLLQMAIVIAIALGLGWAPRGGFAVAVPVLAVGSATFAGIGLLMAGTLRAEATLALSNLLFIIMAPGVFVPLTALPRYLRGFIEFLPSTAFAESLRLAFAGGAALVSSPFAALLVWGVVAVGACALTFKWE